MKKLMFLLSIILMSLIIGCQPDKPAGGEVDAYKSSNSPSDPSMRAPSFKYPPVGIAVSTGSAWAASVVNNSSNWNTAYGWGNHAGLYEPKLGNPSAANYVLTSTTSGVRSWIPMAGGGTMIYPSSGIPISLGNSWGTSIINNSSNWNTAYSWGNHAGLYKLISYVPTWNEITGKPNFDALYKSISYIPAWSEISGKPTTLTGYGIINAMSTSHPANVITAAAITSWTMAYGWGDHEGLYKSVSYVPTWVEITGKPNFAIVATSGDYNDLVNKPSGITCDWPDITNKPITYPPSMHNHDLLYKTVSYVPTWEEITGKPAVYPPSPHSHDLFYKPASYVPTWEEIIGKPTTYTPSTHGHNWTVITNTPATYPPSTHNHDGLYRPISYVPIWAEIIGKPTTVSGYGITNAMTTSHPANVITSVNITNWNTSYSWGNHAGLYKPISYVPTWPEITGKPATYPPSTHNHDTYYKPISYIPTWAEIAGKPAFAVVAISGSYTDLANIPTSFTPKSHAHTWTEITNKPPEQELLEALQLLDYLPIPTRTTAAINTLVPVNSSGIVKDGDLNVYKVYINGVWRIIQTN
jgi:hypothetical protein